MGRVFLVIGDSVDLASDAIHNSFPVFLAAMHVIVLNWRTRFAVKWCQNLTSTTDHASLGPTLLTHFSTREAVIAVFMLF